MSSEIPDTERFSDLIRLRAAADPAAVLLEHARSGRTVSASGLATALQRWIAMLDGHGAGQGAPVVLTIGDPVTLGAVLAAVIGAGRRAVALDPTMPADGLVATLDRLGRPAVRITDDPADAREAATLLLADPSGAPGAVLRTGREDRGWDAGWAPEVTGASILFTSGSTGEPKGVELPEAQLLFVARQVASVLGLTADDRCFNPLPLFHVNAQVVALTASLVSGGTAVLDDRFHRTGFWELLDEKRITWLNAVPAILAVLARSGTVAPPASLRLIRSASAALPEPVAEAFRAVPVIVSWGMTEAASQITSTAPDAPRAGVGEPRGGMVEARAADGARLPAGERGELWIRGPGVIRSYLFGRAEERFDPDGWLRTGDAGSVTEDGTVVVAGRLDDVINRGGELVDPAQVEAVLLKDPRVREVVVAGRPDDVLGAVPIALVVPSDDAPGLEDDLAALAARHLAAFQRPVAIRVVADLPRTATGKVLRARALELLPVGA